MPTELNFPKSGDAYRNARKRARISQERLAGEVGITRRHMIRIEKGQNRPRTDLRDRIAAVLGVDPTTLPAAETMPPFARTA